MTVPMTSTPARGVRIPVFCWEEQCHVYVVQRYTEYRGTFPRKISVPPITTFNITKLSNSSILILMRLLLILLCRHN